MQAFRHIVTTILAVCALGAFVSGAAAQPAGFTDPGARTSGGASGDLTPVQGQVDGGSITVGATAQVVVLFRNDSGRPVQTGAIQLYPSSTVSASVALNQCAAEDLPAGAVCAVGISVKALQAGSWRLEMLMRHSGRARLVTATIAGQVASGEGTDDRFISDVEAIPNELDFGDLQTSQPIVRSVVLRNITSEAVDVNAIYIEAAQQAGYSLRTDCTRLEPGQACIVIVTWSPVLKGDASGVLIIEHSGPTSVASVNLLGDYDPDDTEQADIFPEAVPGKGLLVSSQEEIDFGDGIETISAITVSLVNVGDAPITLRDIRLASTDSGGLSISKSGCMVETILEPVEACPLTITWAPVREGQILDDVQVWHDGARGVLVLPVRGTADSVISQDAKPVRLASGGVISASLSSGDASTEGLQFVRDETIDPASVLDGFVVTSHSPRRAIIAGPGGSRIVFDGEEVVLGGILWNVNIRASGIEFRTGDDKVLLLFDRSLSSVNRVSAQSGGSSGSSAVTSTSDGQ
ncbi:MAG: choice-of-anchor D domain-containing protein [Rhodospirillales bacterium]|nr:choice-of-anchor D domain-containing protein [Rhodospirillales bacterium]MCB9996737.1 choice-of-anchor D domain-containing protein [Rhodospirillales bacterium]